MLEVAMTETTETRVKAVTEHWWVAVEANTHHIRSLWRDKSLAKSEPWIEEAFPIALEIWLPGQEPGWVQDDTLQNRFPAHAFAVIDGFENRELIAIFPDEKDALEWCNERSPAGTPFSVGGVVICANWCGEPHDPEAISEEPRFMYPLAVNGQVSGLSGKAAA